MLILPGAASPVWAGRCGRRGLSRGSLRGRLRPYRGFLAFLPAVGQRFPPGPRAARAAAVGHGHPAEGPGVRWVGKGPLSGWGWRSPGWEPRQRPVRASQDPTTPSRPHLQENGGSALGTTWKPGAGSLPRSLGEVGLLSGRCVSRNLCSPAKPIAAAAAAAAGLPRRLRLRPAAVVAAVLGPRRVRLQPEGAWRAGARLTAPGECPRRLSGLVRLSFSRASLFPAIAAGQPRGDRLLALVH